MTLGKIKKRLRRFPQAKPRKRKRNLFPLRRKFALGELLIAAGLHANT